MCSAYWNLNVPCLICPFCGALDVEPNLQTHFNGDVGDCMNFYEVTDRVPNIGGFTGRLSQFKDSLITQCNTCNRFLDYDLVVDSGRITGIEYIPDREFLSRRKGKKKGKK